MEVTALLGSRGDLQHFADRIFAERGDCFGRVAMIPASAKAQRPPKAYLTIETPTVACLSRVNRVVVTCADHFRSAPNSGHFQRPSARLKCATSGLMHRKQGLTRSAALVAIERSPVIAAIVALQAVTKE